MTVSPGFVILAFILFQAFTTIFLFYLLTKVAMQYTELKVYLDAVLQAQSDSKPDLASQQLSFTTLLEKIRVFGEGLTKLRDLHTTRYNDLTQRIDTLLEEFVAVKEFIDEQKSASRFNGSGSD